MKWPVRYFAIGLLTASLLLLISYHFLKPEETQEVDTHEEMILALEDEGYRVITESEYIELTVAKNKMNDQEEQQEEKEDKENKEDKEEKKETNKESNEKNNDEKKDKKNDKEKQKKVTYTLKVKENMLPSTISEVLEENKIIDDALKFSKFLEDNDYSPYIQIGEFKLTSDMSMEEVAKTLTNK